MGFYNSAMQHLDFTAELAPFTNLTWIATANHERIITRLKAARDNGIQAVLSVQPMLYDGDYVLKPDYRDRLARIHERIESEGLLEYVAMVYPIDEPYSHAAKRETGGRERIYRELSRINPELNDLFPGKPLGVIYSHDEVFRDDFRIPDSYDWIGFDCYYSLYDCDEKPMTAHYSKLLSHMTAEQHLMAVPEAWGRYRNYDRKSYEPRVIYDARRELMVKQLRQRMKHHYEIAVSEPRFIAFIPFLWSMEPAPGKPPKAGFGVDQFEARFPDGGGRQFVNLITRIGTQIKSGNYAYPDLSLKRTEANLRRPRNDDYRGAVSEVSQSGMVSAWGLNRALPHKSLRMQVAVYVDNTEVYTSRVRRSFILDRDLPALGRPALPPIGVHGYRHKLPRDLVDELRGQTAELEFRVIGDREPADRYHSSRVALLL